MLRMMLVAIGTIFILVAGCDSGGPQSVSGTVTLDGQPLPSGDILFVPESGDQGADAGKIEDGKFSFTSKPGKMKVQITAQREVAGKTERGAMGESLAKTEQYLPPRYNTATELTAEVTPGGSNRFEFPLQSK